MPLEPGMLNSAVRLTSCGNLIGTGFIVSVASESAPGRRWTYVLTPDHVVREELEIAVEVPDPLTVPGDLQAPVPVADWRQPLEGIDLAIAPFPAREDLGFMAIHLESHIMPKGKMATLGAQVSYVGIFAPRKVPVARTGTIASLYVDIDKTEENGVRYQYPAYYLDCRSYDGFSGSPCFAQLSFAMLDEPAEPPIDPEPMRRPDGSLPTLGPLAHFQTLCGMFVAHYSDEGVAAGAVSHLGIGVMIRSNEIREALMTDEAKAERKRWDAQHAATEAAQEPTLRNAGVVHDVAEESEFERFEDLTRKLVNTPKPKRDE